MVGANNCANFSLPNLPCRVCQPSTQPGTVTLWMPPDGIEVIPCFLKNSGVSALGDHPLAFSPCIFPDLASKTMANKSPPIPFMPGDRKPIAAFAAMAASIAFPPCARIAAPVCDAIGCSVATMPPRETTIDRPCVRLNDAASRAVAIIRKNDTVTHDARVNMSRIVAMNSFW